MAESGDYRPLVYLPWPVVMDIADRCEANGYRQLASEARKAVWVEAERLAAESGRNIHDKEEDISGASVQTELD